MLAYAAMIASSRQLFAMTHYMPNHCVHEAQGKSKDSSALNRNVQSHGQRNDMRENTRLFVGHCELCLSHDVSDCCLENSVMQSMEVQCVTSV